MDSTLYRFLKWTAIAMGCLWVGWSFYDSFMKEKAPGDLAYLEAETLFEDGYYDRALAKYDEALSEAPDHIHALRGKARSLMQLGKFNAAEREYDVAIAMAPDFGAAYANRGILHDRMGKYAEAIADYEHAIRLDAELADGPHWLTRFLRLQPDRPPTIADRARYLRAQLAKPESERLLRIPEKDDDQRGYKQ